MINNYKTPSIGDFLTFFVILTFSFGISRKFTQTKQSTIAELIIKGKAYASYETKNPSIKYDTIRISSKDSLIVSYGKNMCAILQSSCPKKICTKKGSIKNGMSVCVPNSAILKFKNAKDSIDGIAQ